MNFPRRFILRGLAGAMLSGCAGETKLPAGLPESPTAFRESPGPTAGVTSMPAGGAWWDIFADATLNDIVARASRNNWTIKLAASRLAFARAAAQSSFARQMPRIGASAGATNVTGPLTNAASGSGALFTSAVNLSYEVDLFGRLARESEAASLDVGEREALLRGAVLLIQADAAETYFALRALAAERAIVQDAATAQAKAVALTQGLVTSGLTSELALARLRAEAEATAAEAMELDRRGAGLEHALSVLVGESAATFPIAALASAMEPPIVPAGIPATVLARRADVFAARQAMLAAQTRVGVARDSWLPNLSLTAAAGFASPQVGSLLAASAATSALGALLSLPLFDGGQYEARVDAAHAALDGAAALYAQQILVAIRDVEDQLSGLRILAQQQRSLRAAADAARRTTALVASNYRSGLASQLELLDAQRTELRDRRQEARVHAARFQASIGLIRALGGGWDPGV
jgi:multidrug efflux system outer membrane protein